MFLSLISIYNEGMPSLNKLTSQITRLQSRIQDLLEKEEEIFEIDESMSDLAFHFESLQDPGLVDNLTRALPEQMEDRAVFMFSRLALFFDAGVFLEKTERGYEPQAFFHQGRVRACHRKHRAQALQLPAISHLEVAKIKTSSLLRKIDLINLDPQDRLTALLFSPAPDFSYLLMSRLPDLWLRDHAQRVAFSLSKGLGFE